MEQDSSSMEKRFSYKFLKRLLQYVDSAQEFIAHLGECDRRTECWRGPYGALICAPSCHVDSLLIQRPWLQVGRRTNRPMTRKSSSSQRSGGSAAHIDTHGSRNITVIEMVPLSRSCSPSPTRRLRTTVCTSCPRPAGT